MLGFVHCLVICPCLRAHTLFVLHVCLSLRPCQKWVVSRLWHSLSSSYYFRVLSKRGNCRHPIFDRPQDLDVTVWTLGDYPCLCSFGVPGGLGSRALPQDLRTRLFSVWFCTKHLCFALEGLWDIPTHHRQWLEATGWFLLPSAIFYAGRHILLPVGTLFCQNDIFGQPTTVHLLYVDILCQLW